MPISPNISNFNKLLLDVGLNLEDNEKQLTRLLKIKNISYPSISGLVENDYVLDLSDKYLFSKFSFVEDYQTSIIPLELIDLINVDEGEQKIGLFKQIKSAYFIARSSFYLWNYVSSEILCYDGFTESITFAALIEPKTNTTEITFDYLLCLISHNNIVLLKLSNAQDETNSNLAPNNSFCIEPEPFVTISSDGVIFTHAYHSVIYDRFFLAGQDGSLYELYYQYIKSWLGKKAWLINHSRGKLSSLIFPNLRNIFSPPDPLIQIAMDESRGILYTLSERGSIQLFYLGAFGTEMSHIVTVPHHEIHSRAMAITKLIENDKFGRIVSLCPLSILDSKSLHLMAITSSGFRYYFTAYAEDNDILAPLNVPFNSYNNANGINGQNSLLTSPEMGPTGGIKNDKSSNYSWIDCVPFMLKLLHIRFPPGYATTGTSNGVITNAGLFGQENNMSLSTTFQRISSNAEVYGGLHDNGSTLFLTCDNELFDTVWISNSDAFSHKPILMEQLCKVSIDGKIQAIECIDDYNACDVPFTTQRTQLTPITMNSYVEELVKNLWLQINNSNPSFNASDSGINTMQQTLNKIQTFIGENKTFDGQNMVTLPSFTKLLQYKINLAIALDGPMKQCYRSRAQKEIYQRSRSFIILTSRKLITFNIADPSSFLKTSMLASNGDVNSVLVQSLVTNLSSLTPYIPTDYTNGSIPKPDLTSFPYYAPMVGGGLGTNDTYTNDFIYANGHTNLNSMNDNTLSVKTMDTSFPLSLAIHLLCSNGPGQQQIKEWIFNFCRNYDRLTENVETNFQQNNASRTYAEADLTNVKYSSTPFYKNFSKNMSQSSPNKRSRFRDQNNMSYQTDPYQSTILNSQQNQYMLRNRLDSSITNIQRAFLRYFWRIVKPVWNMPLCTTFEACCSVLGGLTPDQLEKYRILPRSILLQQYNNNNCSTNNPPSNPDKNILLRILPLYNANDMKCLAKRLDALSQCLNRRDEGWALLVNTVFASGPLTKGSPKSTANSSLAFANRNQEMRFRKTPNITNTPKGILKHREQTLNTTTDDYDIDHPHQSFVRSPGMVSFPAPPNIKQEFMSQESSGHVGSFNRLTDPPSTPSIKREHSTMISSGESNTMDGQKFANLFVRLVNISRELAHLYSILLTPPLSFTNTQGKVSIKTNEYAYHIGLVIESLSTGDQNDFLNQTFSSIVLSTNSTTKNTKTPLKSPLGPNVSSQYADFESSLDYNYNQSPHIAMNNSTNQLITRLINAYLNVYACVQLDNINNPPTYLMGRQNATLSDIPTLQSVCEPLIHKIQDIAPTFYGPDQGVISKANELLISALKIPANMPDGVSILNGSNMIGVNTKNIHDNTTSNTLGQTKHEFLHKALNLYTSIGPDNYNLQSVCGQFQKCGFYYGIIKLCLNAGKSYMTNLLSTKNSSFLNMNGSYNQNNISPDYRYFYMNDDEPMGTKFSADIYRKRMHCYEILLAALGHYQSLYGGDNLGNSSFTNDTQYDMLNHSNPNMSQSFAGSNLTLASDTYKLSTKREFGQLLKECTNTGDELFSYLFYDWLKDHGFGDYLTKIQSPFIQTYFGNMDKTQPSTNQPLLNDTNPTVVSERKHMLEIKCQFLQNSKQFHEAAHVFMMLAEISDKSILLPARLEYLSKALLCARTALSLPKSANITTTNFDLTTLQQMIQEIEDKIDVAQIQMKIINQLQQIYADTKDPIVLRSIERLNIEIFDLTKLYEDFCEKFYLYETELDIIQVASNTDSDLICEVWTKILDYTLHKDDIKSPIASPSTSKSLSQYKLQSLLNTITRIGRNQLSKANTSNSTMFNLYFPLAFLIKYLANFTFENQVDPNSVILQTFIELGIPVDRLIKEYVELFNSSISNRVYNHFIALTLIKFMHYMVDEDMFDNKNINKYAITNVCQDFLANFNIMMQSHIVTSGKSIKDDYDTNSTDNLKHDIRYLQDILNKI